MSVNENPCVNCGAKDYQLGTTKLGLLRPEDPTVAGTIPFSEVRMLACKRCGHISLYAEDFFTPNTLK